MKYLFLILAIIFLICTILGLIMNINAGRNLKYNIEYSDSIQEEENIQDYKSDKILLGAIITSLSAFLFSLSCGALCWESTNRFRKNMKMRIKRYLYIVR
jgi:hypothetical protein